jgi:ATP-dependent DNA helicase RecQ
MKATNLKQTQVRTIKADLLDQKIIREAMYGKSKKFEYQYNAPELDTTTFEALRHHRLKEFKIMEEYTNTNKCKMLYLCNYLGDSNSISCEICDSCLHDKNRFSMTQNDREKIKQFQDNFFPILEVETTRTNLINGIASSYYGFSNVGAIIHKCKYEKGGDYPTILLKQTLRAFGRTFKEQKFDLVLFIPPTKSGKLVENFANKIASTLKLPILPLVKTRDTKEQKIFQNSALKIENIKDAFDINIDIMDKSILLIDDIFDSGATIKEIGKMLTSKGAKIIAPLVIAKTVGGDIAN